MITTLLIVFLANIVSNALGTLKTIFISKKISKPAYIVTFFDSIVFAYGFKTVANEDSFLFILVFSAGKVIGAFLGDYLDNKIALGSVELSFFLEKEKAMKVADILRLMEFKVLTAKCYGEFGEEFFQMNIAAERKETALINEILVKEGINLDSIIIREIRKAKASKEAMQTKGEDGKGILVR